MKKDLNLIFILICSACSTQPDTESSLFDRQHKSSPYSITSKIIPPEAWVNNKELYRNYDTILLAYYGDTILATGPGKYLSPGGECGDNDFYGESLYKSEKQPIDEFMEGLRSARNAYCNYTIEHCSDFSEFERGEQNLQIIEAYYHCQAGADALALELLNKQQKFWKWPSRHHDLMIGILLGQHGRTKILNRLQTKTGEQLTLFGVDFYWTNVSSYHFAEFENYDWLAYFKKVTDQIEQYGI